MYKWNIIGLLKQRKKWNELITPFQLILGHLRGGSLNWKRVVVAWNLSWYQIFDSMQSWYPLLSLAHCGDQETYSGQSVWPLYLWAIRHLHGSTYWKKFLPNCVFLCSVCAIKWKDRALSVNISPLLWVLTSWLGTFTAVLWAENCCLLCHHKYIKFRISGHTKGPFGKQQSGTATYLKIHRNVPTRITANFSYVRTFCCYCCCCWCCCCFDYEILTQQF